MPVRRPRRRLAHASLLACACALAAALALASAPAPGNGASSSVVLTMTVPSASYLNTAACATGSAATQLGTLLPGSSAVTSAPCDIVFGSTNDTSMLRVAQADGNGAAMYRLTDGLADSAYGAGGLKATSATLTMVGDAAVDATGRLYVAGTRNSNFSVARYLANGTLDTTWGASGYAEVSMPLPNGVNCPDVSRGIAIDSSGRVVVVGYSLWGEDPPDIFPAYCAASPGVLQQYASVVRFTAAGVPDTSFSGDGIVGNVGIVASQSHLHGQSWEDVTIAPDGTIVVAGARHPAAVSGEDGFLGRYSPVDGSELSTVSVNQWVANDWDDWFSALTIQGDGNVVAAGSYYRNDTSSTYATMYRTSPLLVADASFGTGGQQLVGTNVGTVNDVAQVSGGSLLAVTNVRRLLQRLPNGAADPSFDSDGVQTLPGIGTPASMLVHEDGSILVASDTTASGGDVDWLLQRVTAAGAIDPRFSQDGEQVYEPTANTDTVASIVDGRDGAVYVVGRHDTTGGILRLRGATALDFSASSADWSAGASTFGACLESRASAAAAWGMTGSCTASNGDPWNAIPTSTVPSSSKVASAATGVASAHALLRFGMRAGASQAPGDYIAPISFTTIAPDG